MLSSRGSVIGLDGCFLAGIGGRSAFVSGVSPRSAVSATYRGRVNTVVGGVAVIAVSVVALAACATSAPSKTVTVTVPPAEHSGATASAKAAPSPSRAPTRAPPVMTRLPGSCYALLPADVVFGALHTRPPGGRDAFVVGVGDRSIGRVQYINCQYGLTATSTAAKPKVEITVSLYRTAAQAASRVRSTITDYQAHGAHASAVTVDGRPGTFLTGGSGSGYQVPVLVSSNGQRTVAVSMTASVATGAQLATKATTIATLALRETAG